MFCRVNWAIRPHRKILFSGVSDLKGEQEEELARELGGKEVFMVLKVKERGELLVVLQCFFGYLKGQSMNTVNL